MKKIYTVQFEAVYPVPSGLVILADSIEEAREIAKKTVTHTDDIKEPVEVDTSTSGVIFYESGDY